MEVSFRSALILLFIASFLRLSWVQLLVLGLVYLLYKRVVLKLQQTGEPSVASAEAS